MDSAEQKSQDESTHAARMAQKLSDGLLWAAHSAPTSAVGIAVKQKAAELLTLLDILVEQEAAKRT
jgi:type 1 glutamine amidotransferase